MPARCAGRGASSTLNAPGTRCEQHSLFMEKPVKGSSMSWACSGSGKRQRTESTNARGGALNHDRVLQLCIVNLSIFYAQALLAMQKHADSTYTAFEQLLLERQVLWEGAHIH